MEYTEKRDNIICVTYPGDKWLQKEKIWFHSLSKVVMPGIDGNNH
tara:strand:- start:244 stop:378 length:135 start_codon:yes stop_codon:yes gene_type:complete